jgi:hypothetical protein
VSVLPDPGASRAVLVGASRYEYLEQLAAVSNNLRALAGLLCGPLSLQLPARHVSVVEDPAAADTVMGAVRKAAAEATDTLIVYFAGHGLVDSRDGLSLALPHSESGRVETVLPYDWLREVLLLDSRAERHVVILDCCYSGRALGRMSAEPALVFNDTQDAYVGGELKACCVPTDSDACLRDCGVRWRRHLADEEGMRRPSRQTLGRVREGREARGGAGAHGRGGRGQGRGAGRLGVGCLTRVVGVV